MTIQNAEADLEKLKSMSKHELIRLVENGILKPMQPILSITNMSKEETPEYKSLDYLDGSEIHISKAAKKYNIPLGTVSRWVRRGIIETIRYEKNKRVINERDLAYAALIRERRGSRRGRWLFNDNGSPYIPTTDRPDRD